MSKIRVSHGKRKYLMFPVHVQYFEMQGERTVNNHLQFSPTSN